ncbi:hypothetical protein HA052_04325 [Chromobacterium haemolyticum]|uniref:Uncharacterized protein n=1 Tax=Chromobacterium fluminis TaxID=3044269 RepID=A0ABX0L4D3_9NEIS|nr:hypothetical protein [Chromobacterium haemolyticum]NHR04416.1 hypothetical protein [Chromobacterium haemolyticum]
MGLLVILNQGSEMEEIPMAEIYPSSLRQMLGGEFQLAQVIYRQDGRYMAFNPESKECINELATNLFQEFMRAMAPMLPIAAKKQHEFIRGKAIVFIDVSIGEYWTDVSEFWYH